MSVVHYKRIMGLIYSWHKPPFSYVNWGHTMYILTLAENTYRPQKEMCEDIDGR